MKIIQILRHAKTEMQQIGQQDIDRKLTARGLGQMADLLLNRKANLEKAEHILVSTAVRTRMTFNTLLTIFPEMVVEFDEKLYLASRRTLKECIEKQDDSVQNILLIGHNNGLSDFVSYLVDAAVYLPTSGYVELELPVESWSHITKGMASMRAEFFSEFR